MRHLFGIRHSVIPSALVIRISSFSEFMSFVFISD